MGTVEDIFNRYQELMPGWFFDIVLTSEKHLWMDSYIRTINGIPERYRNVEVNHVKLSCDDDLKKVYIEMQLDDEDDEYISLGSFMKKTIFDIIPKVIIVENGSGRIYSGPITTVPNAIKKRKYLKAEINMESLTAIITVR